MAISETFQWNFWSNIDSCFLKSELEKRIRLFFFSEVLEGSFKIGSLSPYEQVTNSFFFQKKILGHPLRYSIYLDDEQQFLGCCFQSVAGLRCRQTGLQSIVWRRSEHYIFVSDHDYSNSRGGSSSFLKLHWLLIEFKIGSM